MGFDIMRLSIILLVVGGLNCGSIGVLGKDFVSGALGRGTAARVLHVAIGLAAVYVVLCLFGVVEGFLNAPNGAPNAPANGSVNAALLATNGAPAVNAPAPTEGFKGCRDC